MAEFDSLSSILISNSIGVSNCLYVLARELDLSSCPMCHGMACTGKQMHARELSSSHTRASMLELTGKPPLKCRKGISND